MSFIKSIFNFGNILAGSKTSKKREQVSLDIFNKMQSFPQKTSHPNIYEFLYEFLHFEKHNP
ncbi:hypothetical protein AYB34_15775 [Leptospira sp. ZV016]|nr:hypothetical protein LEP1GSC166_3004 [Leptospira kirschneri]KXZ26262.1 hypothetical protein AYB32_16405 [Leptospira kirschneri]KXZ30719.1 hypothetical protein AYB34_15775 [Leptospira sp. ZV016]